MYLPCFKKMAVFIVFVCFVLSCSSRKPFWTYVVEDDVDKPMQKRKVGEIDSPRAVSPHNVRVSFNDGGTTTEVLIPILSSGQQIVIDHKSKGSATGVALVPFPPSEADKSIEEAYVKSGKPIQKSAKPVSIVKSHQKIRELAKLGEYEVALEYVAQILSRYPKHVKTIRSKGSLLLKMGEVDAAYKAYNEAQEIEPDPLVESQIKNIEKMRN